MTSTKLKLCLISDTHNGHRALGVLPQADVLIHAGDFTDKGTLAEAGEFLQWFSQQPHKYKILIAGNHDGMAQRRAKDFREALPANVIYLENSGAIIEGLVFYGTPYSPTYSNYAFQKDDTAEELGKIWALIPKHTDVLITHGPAYGIHDNYEGIGAVGSKTLREKLEEVKPKLHVFGHIHESRGASRWGKTIVVNAAVTTRDNKPVFNPFVIEI